MLKEKQILIVDDLTTNIQLLIGFLEEQKKEYSFLIATNGEAALHIMKKKKPDLVLTDWEMPNISGLELIRISRQENDLKDIPFIVISGMRTEAEDLKEAMDLGARDFLRKPLNKMELWARVDSVLRLAEAYQTIKAQKLEIEAQKNRELSTKALLVLQKNKLLSEVHAQLEKEMLERPVPERASLKKLMRLLDSDRELEQEWDQFKLHFEQVHPRFFSSLQKLSAQLTNYDFRFCSYLKIGLSSKEIAALLHIEYNSVRIHKTRLKKKLNLPSEQGLDEFLISLA